VTARNGRPPGAPVQLQRRSSFLTAGFFTKHIPGRRFFISSFLLRESRILACLKPPSINHQVSSLISRKTLMCRHRQLRFLLTAISCAILAFPCSAAAEVFQGKVFEVWEERADTLSGNSYLILERSGEQNLKLESVENLKRYEGKTIRVEGDVVAPLLLRVNSVVSVLPETRRVVTRVDMRFLTGIFNIGGMTTISRTKPEVEEIITGEPTKSLKALLDFNSYGAINISACVSGPFCANTWRLLSLV
jgi:hypothetical protein